MQTIKKIHCVGSRKICRYWKKGCKKKNLGTSALDQSISLKFLLETRDKSESFEPLIDFLAFLVQKL